MRFFCLFYLGCDIKHCKVKARWFRLKVQQSGSQQMTETHMRVCGGTTFYRAILMVTTGISFRSVYLYDAALTQSCCVTVWVMASYAEVPLLLLGSIYRIWLSINKVLSRISTAESSNIPNHTRTLKSPKHTNNKIVPSSEMGFFGALWRQGNCCFVILISNSLFRKTLLTRLRPASVSWRQVYGSIYWAVRSNWTASLCIDLGRRLILQ